MNFFYSTLPTLYLYKQTIQLDKIFAKLDAEEVISHREGGFLRSITEVLINIIIKTDEISYPEII